MRMRKLGSGQSVVFCVSDEIRARIVQATGGSLDMETTVLDILAWAISETHRDSKRTIPLWAAQGRNFIRHKDLWEEAKEGDGLNMDQNAAEKFLEDEAKSIESRYRPSSTSQDVQPVQSSGHRMLDLISKRCLEFDCTEVTTPNLEEEQERQVAPEVDAEREVERPPPAEALAHNLHRNVVKFVQTGTIPKGRGFRWAFETLRSPTSTTGNLEGTQFYWPAGGLRVTEDFAQTIKRNLASPSYDTHQRNVQYVLTGANNESGEIQMVAISQYEANKLVHDIKIYAKVTLHLYAPRQNQAFAPLDHLQLYNISSIERQRLIPERLILELNLFAGQLYFSNFKEYIRVCDYLGLAWSAEKTSGTVRADGFIQKGPSSSNKSTFSQSPVQFLKVLFTRIRRDCGSIEKTHMGKMLDGNLLDLGDFPEREKRNILAVDQSGDEDRRENLRR